MIGFLRGRLLEIAGERLLLDVGGVGYELNCSQSTLADVEEQGLVSLRVHTHVRDDAIQLFGFSSTKEKEVFLNLLKVSGIGPKLALQILSAVHHDRLLQLIRDRDVKGLSQLPRLGKKKAEQLILTLEGHLIEVDTPGQPEQRSPRAEVVSALVNLGFRPADVDRVTQDMDPQMDVEQGIRSGLQQLTQL